MEKTVTIDGKTVCFRSTGSLPLRYKAQTKRDFFADIMKLDNIIDKKTKGIDFDTLDLEIFYNLAWCMAKTADSTIPPPIEWLDKFECFPIVLILTELQDLLLKSIIGSNVNEKN